MRALTLTEINDCKIRHYLFYCLSARRAVDGPNGASVKNGHNHIQGVRDKANAILATVMTALSR